MSARIETVKQLGQQLFDKRSGVLSLWQEIAENFYPERADFTSARNVGADLAANLLTSAPVIARRDLGNAFSSMLRPAGKNWLSKMRTNRPEKEDTIAKQWLEWATNLQRNAMYDRSAMFSRATKEGDHDFAGFGQAVLTVELNRQANGLLYRCWHLRDVAWCENDEGKVTTIFHKRKMPAIDLVRMFPKTVHADVRKKLEKTPYDEIDVWRAVLPIEQYMHMGGGEPMRQPYVSIYIDIERATELECVGQWVNPYVIPRWQTISGSQYAVSPAVVASISNARSLQVIMRTLLEAGEKATNPPLIGVQEALRSDLNMMAGGFTAVDAAYDERLGEVLRPLTQDKSGFPFGVELFNMTKEEIAEAWYLNKLSLPPQGGPNMTAYEVGQRVQEFIRNALPLFEPMESEYNGQLCEVTFELLLRAGGFGPIQSIPQSIQGADIEFVFESPLREAADKAKANQFVEAQQILATAIQLDPSAVHIVDGRKATRDVLEAIAPAGWLRPEHEVDARVESEQQAAKAQQMLDMLQQGADTAKTLGETQPVGVV